MSGSIGQNDKKFAPDEALLKKVWFLPDNLKEPVEFVGVDGEVYTLNPDSPALIPELNALAFEYRGAGRVLRSPDEIVKHVFLNRARAIPPTTPHGTHDLGGRQPVHVQFSNASDPEPSPITPSSNPRNWRYIDDPSGLLLEEVIFSENYTSIEPAKRLVELAEKLGYLRTEFEAEIFDYFGYQCESGHLIFYPKVKGGRLNPFKQQQNARKSAQALVDKLIQLNEEAKVLERDSKTGVLRLCESNNLYLIPMELTYPHELNSLFVELLRKDKAKFYQLREEAVKRFFAKVLAYEFGDYAEFSEFIYWLNHHDWSSKEPNKAHFHEHINLLNVTFDWRGSEEFRALREALRSKLTPTVEDIAEFTGWSVAKVKRVISFFKGKGLIEYSKKGRFFTSMFFELPAPLVRFNPLKFTAQKSRKGVKRLEAYQKFWKEAIEEVFNVKLDVLPVVHLPDEVIKICPENRAKLIHRLAYCSRKPITDVNNFLEAHPNADFDLEWLEHLLTYDNRLKGSKIAKKLSKYTGVEFLATIKNRYYRLRKKQIDLIEELRELEARERELISLLGLNETFDNLDEFVMTEKLKRSYLEELEKIRAEKEKLESELSELRELAERIDELEEKYKPVVECPLCGSVMHAVHEKPSVDTPLLYFDSCAKKWVLRWENG